MPRETGPKVTKPSPTGLMWLSFSGDEGFLGACVVEGRDVLDASEEARLRDCNPGGEVLGFPVPLGGENVFPHNVLMSLEDIERYEGGPPLRTHGMTDEEASVVNDLSTLLCETHNVRLEPPE
jgi:hypothetical protein